MTFETLALWGTVALCAAIAIVDPAAHLKRWIRSHRRARHAAGRGKPGTNADPGEGAAPVAVVPFPGYQVLVDHHLEVTNAMALGHYLSRAAKTPVARS